MACLLRNPSLSPVLARALHPTAQYLRLRKHTHLLNHYALRDQRDARAKLHLSLVMEGRRLRIIPLHLRLELMQIARLH